jgi:signal transduction histidine kinase
VLLYGITSSVVLTVIIVGISIINYKQNLDQTQALFQKNAEQIVEKIRSDNRLNSSWMIKTQLDNHMIVIVEENGKQLTSYNRLNTSLEPEELVRRMKEQADAEGINLNRKPLYSKIEKTGVHSLYQNKLEAYYGIATLLPKDNGWQNIMAFYCDDHRVSAQIGQFLLLTVLDLVGVAAMFLISSLYISKVIRPLEEGQKKQNAFVAAASHELRSPLTIIKSGIASIREDITKADQFLPYVEEECDRMTRLISDMLLLASTDANSWSITMEQVDMDTLLIECFDMFCICYNINNQLSLKLPEEQLKVVIGDPQRIKQIFTILVDNAMSYTPGGKPIVLRAYNQKHSVVVEVEDHGNGIRDEDKNRIFERFYRGDKSRNEKKHFGLGLSIAKELVELHHGDIFVRDTEGGGATFVLRLHC